MSDRPFQGGNGISTGSRWPAWLLVRDGSTVVAIFLNTQEGRVQAASLLSRLLTTRRQEQARIDVVERDPKTPEIGHASGSSASTSLAMKTGTTTPYLPRGDSR